MNLIVFLEIAKFFRVNSEEMVYSNYIKQRISYWLGKGLKAPSIYKKLSGEGLSCSTRGIHKFIVKYEATGSINRKRGSGRPSKVTEEVEAIIEGQMQANDETTVAELQRLLKGQAIIYRGAPFFAAENGWVGVVAEQLTANLSARRTERSA